MKNMISIACLFILGLFLISYKKIHRYTHPAKTSQERQLAAVPPIKIPSPTHQILPKVTTTIRKNPATSKLVIKKASSLPVVKTAPLKNPHQKETAVTPQQAPHPQEEAKQKVEVSSLQVPTQKDIELLKAVAERSRQQGSKVAYIGELPALYTFEPRFFFQQADATGKTSWQLQGVNDSSSGFFVQREPYPVPTGSMNDYTLLSKVIVRAANDGATLINITATNLDRTRLASAIDYAHSRGVPVIAAGVNPTQ